MISLARICKKWSVREMIARSMLFSYKIFECIYFWFMSVYEFESVGEFGWLRRGYLDYSREYIK